jgi:hypothetical protein
MSTKQKYTQKLLLALIGSKKSLQHQTLSALYEMGKDGDFTATGNSKIDAILEQLLEEEEMPDSIGEIYELLRKKIKTHLSTKN